MSLNYRFKNFYFLPLLDHPGYFYLQKKTPGDSKPIVDGLSNCMVVFAIFSLMMIPAGQLMWFLVSMSKWFFLHL